MKYVFIVFLLPVTLLTAQDTTLPSSAKVDFDGFMALSAEVEEYRRSRLIDLPTFLAMAKQEDVIILDTRSKAAYDRKHLKGARHLNFSDFTEEKLAQVLPSKAATVLIYCNNNFGGDEENFAAKRMPLALNIPTFINLYGYGYKNLYELSDFIAVSHQELSFEGTDPN